MTFFTGNMRKGNESVLKIWNVPAASGFLSLAA